MDRRRPTKGRQRADDFWPAERHHGLRRTTYKCLLTTHGCLVTTYRYLITTYRWSPERRACFQWTCFQFLIRPPAHARAGAHRAPARPLVCTSVRLLPLAPACTPTASAPARLALSQESNRRTIEIHRTPTRQSETETSLIHNFMTESARLRGMSNGDRTDCEAKGASRNAFRHRTQTTNR